MHNPLTHTHTQAHCCIWCYIHICIGSIAASLAGLSSRIRACAQSLRAKDSKANKANKRQRSKRQKAEGQRSRQLTKQEMMFKDIRDPAYTCRYLYSLACARLCSLKREAARAAKAFPATPSSPPSPPLPVLPSATGSGSRSGSKMETQHFRSQNSFARKCPVSRASCRLPVGSYPEVPFGTLFSPP